MNMQKIVGGIGIRTQIYLMQMLIISHVDRCAITITDTLSFRSRPVESRHLQIDISYTIGVFLTHITIYKKALHRNDIYSFDAIGDNTRL